MKNDFNSKGVTGYASTGRISLLLTASLVLAITLTLTTGCDAAGPSALAGRWVHEGGSADKKPEEMELFKDGTGVCSGATISWKTEGKRFVLLSSFNGFTSDYEVSGSRLTLTDNAGKKSTYVNINDKKKSWQKKGSFTDSRDGKKYGTTKIGNQTWMTENLNYETGGKCGGTDIKTEIVETELRPKVIQQSEREYIPLEDKNTVNCDKYGRLYDWETAKTVCPSGWHLPSKEEWQTLADFFGGDEVAGKKLKAVSGWEPRIEERGRDRIEISGNGTDIYGFSALPGGMGYGTNKSLNKALGILSRSSISFSNVGRNGSWWSASEDNSYGAYYRRMDYINESVHYGSNGKDFLFSVRCLQD